jgi:hypothetical protein
MASARSETARGKLGVAPKGIMLPASKHEQHQTLSNRKDHIDPSEDEKWLVAFAFATNLDGRPFKKVRVH